MSGPIARDVKIVAWDDIEAEFTDDSSSGGSLLLGNGFSSNIWPKFAYRTLLGESDLAGTAFDLFAGRTNFEAVLAELAITQQVMLLAAPTEQGLSAHLEDLADEVRDGLLRAVNAVHPNHHQLESLKPIGSSAVSVHVIRRRVADQLPRYSSIFTTNYDLLCYWASVQSDVADLLPGPDPFILGQAESWASGRKSKIYFLHGALHMWRSLRDNTEGKYTAGVSDLLLEVVRRSVDDPDRVPLFISEGSAAQKVARISSSPYLTFCARQLQRNTDPLTVLGHSLADSDQHICDAVQGNRDRKVAIGVWVGHAVDAEEQLTIHARQLRARLPRCRDVVFFDSGEHPLTDSDLVCAA